MMAVCNDGWEGDDNEMLVMLDDNNGDAICEGDGTCNAYGVDDKNDEDDDTGVDGVYESDNDGGNDCGRDVDNRSKDKWDDCDGGGDSDDSDDANHGEDDKGQGGYENDDVHWVVTMVIMVMTVIDVMEAA